MSEVIAALSRKIESTPEPSTGRPLKDVPKPTNKRSMEPFVDRALLPSGSLVPVEAILRTSTPVKITPSPSRMGARLFWPFSLMIIVTGFVFGMFFMVYADGGASTFLLLMMLGLASFVALPSIRSFLRAFEKSTRSLKVTFGKTSLKLQRLSLFHGYWKTVPYADYSGIRHETFDEDGFMELVHPDQTLSVPLYRGPDNNPRLPLEYLVRDYAKKFGVAILEPDAPNDGGVSGAPSRAMQDLR